MKQMTRIAFCFILFLSTVSCVSTTTIKALNKKGEIDKDVKVYVDNKYIGNGEAVYSDNNSSYAPLPFLEFKKEGCRNHREKLDVQTNWINNLSGAAINGIGIGVVLLTPGNILSWRTALLVGLPISVAGLTLMSWGRKYVPVQQQEFQCIKMAE